MWVDMGSLCEHQHPVPHRSYIEILGYTVLPCYNNIEYNMVNVKITGYTSEYTQGDIPVVKNSLKSL